MAARAVAGEPSDIVGWMADCPLIAVQVVNYWTRRWLERCADTVVSDLEGSSMAFGINLLGAGRLFTVDTHRRFQANRQR